MKISDRISFIQKQVSADSKIIYDLCCDHGKIGEAFISKDSTVVFVDQIESIVKNLKNRLNPITTDIPLPNIKFRITNAIQFKITKTELKNTIIMAGIGGKLSISILKNVIPQLKQKDEIIVSAQSEILLVRQFLAQTNCRLIEETLIKDNDKFYEILKLGFYGDKLVTPFGEDIWYQSSLDNCQTYLEELKDYYQLKLQYNPQYKYEFSEYSKIAKNLRQD